MTTRSRWWARGALIAAGGAVIALVAGPAARSIFVLVVVAVQLLLIVMGLWLFIAHRGLLRWVGAAIAVAMVVSLVLVNVVSNLVGVAIAVALFMVAGVAARRAVRGGPSLGSSALPAAAPKHPVIVMNPRSGGGKVVKFNLREEAERLGARVVVLEGPGFVDVTALAQAAVADGADLLGVAAGDGTQALVAGVAADHDVPLLVIPAGTRNHFASDLGLDLADPAAALQALNDGEDLAVDLGYAAGRPFVNNASFGAYAAVVGRADYRDAKVKTTLDTLPDLVTGADEARLTVVADERTVADPTVALVSNNPYGRGGLSGVDHRPRLDTGMLGLAAASVHSAADAVTLLSGTHNRKITVATAHRIVITSDAGSIHAGIDGESVELETPVECHSRPHALRVRLPRQRPGSTAAPMPPLRRLVELAMPVRAHHAAGQ